MHYLVTGGLGFIGSHLCERLFADGHQVTILDDLSTGKRENLSAPATIIEGDITTPDIFNALVAKVDGCFHLAAIASVQRSEEDWLRTHQVNLGGTVALFDAIQRSTKKIPVVFASSAAVYGESTDSPVREMSEARPCSAYGTDKLSCEFQASIASTIHAIPTIGLRFFNVYGERQDPNSSYSGVISIFAERMKHAKPVTIFGDGKQTRDFIYVSDVVQALISSMQKLETKTILHGIYNIGTGTQISVEQLAAHIAAITKSTSIITRAPARSGDLRYSQSDITLSRNALNFSPRVTLEDGLLRTLDSL